jgi:hypothetical protein
MARTVHEVNLTYASTGSTTGSRPARVRRVVLCCVFLLLAIMTVAIWLASGSRYFGFRCSNGVSVYAEQGCIVAEWVVDGHVADSARNEDTSISVFVVRHFLPPIYFRDALPKFTRSSDVSVITSQGVIPMLRRLSIPLWLVCLAWSIALVVVQARIRWRSGMRCEVGGARGYADIER